MNKLSVIRLVMFATVIFLISCSNDKSYDFSGDSGKVYMKIQSSNMVNAMPNVANGSISKNILGVFGNTKIKFPVCSTMPANENIEISIGVDNSLVEVYNSKHNTSYKILNTNYLSFDCNTLIIKKQQMISEDSIEVSLEATIEENLELGEYLVPLKLQKISGNMSVSQNWNTIYWVISVSAGIDNVPVANRSNWTVKECSSEEEPQYEGGSNGPAICVLDGNYATYWQTGWSSGDIQPPHSIAIDMGINCEMCGIQYISRDHSLDWPKKMLVEVSVDGEEWMETAIYDNLPQGRNVEFRSLFDEPVEARYFRLTIVEMYGGRPYTALAEVNAFIK